MDKKSKLNIDKCCKLIEGTTPHGGVRLEVYFFDKDDKPYRQENAVKARILKKDEDNTIFAVYGVYP